MSITQITEREQQLTHYLAEMTKALELMRQERDREIARHDSMAIYNDQLAAENKVLRDALELMVDWFDDASRDPTPAPLDAARAALTRSKS